MTRALVYTGLAEDDLNELFDFIAADNPLRARSYIEEIQQACRTLGDTPLLDTARPDIQRDLRILSLWRRVNRRLSHSTWRDRDLARFLSRARLCGHYGRRRDRG